MSAVLMTISNLSTRSEISQNLRNLNIPEDKYCEFLEMKGIFEFNLSLSSLLFLLSTLSSLLSPFSLSFLASRRKMSLLLPKHDTLARLQNLDSPRGIYSFR